MCHVDGATVHDEPQMPFGGVKESGFGRAEAGPRSRSQRSCAGSRSAGRRAATTRSRTSDRFLGQARLSAAGTVAGSLTALPARS
jgi:acyl-CoA reductase-like NAD-dependent aldehyde dehydrogenase